MYISELSSPTLLVIYPGRFQPFHKGHHKVYEFLTGKFGRNNVFIATSNKVDGNRSPFTFSEKAYFMQLTGVPADRIVQAAQPYQIESILQTSNIQVNAANTVVIFAVSEKDMSENPRFKSWTKKDGSPAYFQPLEDIKNTKNMTEHGYIMTVPTFTFTVLGQPMRDGTALRAQYVAADEPTRQAIIKDLFGKYTVEAEQVMTNKLVPKAPTSVQMTPHPTEPQAALGEHIVKHGSQYRLLSKHGNKNLGTFPTKAAAEKHEREVQYFKHAGESVEEGKGTSVKAWAAQVRNEHGSDVKFTNKVTAGGIDNRAIARNAQGETVGVYNRNTGDATVFEPTQGVAEDAGGVGVIANKKQASDPRYSTSLTKDVRPGALAKNLKAFNLTKKG